MNEQKQVYLARHPEHGFTSELPYNTGIMVVGNPAPPDQERTIVITGTPRGGTTMVAECLRALGLPIGVNGPATGSRFNLEDPEFQALLGRESPGEIDLPSLRALALRRKLDHRVWGFKLPMALNSLPILEQELHGPQFILIFRDAIAVSSREVVAVGIEAVGAPNPDLAGAHDRLRRILRGPLFVALLRKGAPVPADHGGNARELVRPRDFRGAARPSRRYNRSQSDLLAARGARDPRSARL